PPPLLTLHSFPTRRSSDLAQTCVDVAHEHGELLLVRLAWDLLEHAVDLGVVHDVAPLRLGIGHLLDQRVRPDPVSVGDVVVADRDRKSTRLNSSHLVISYA